MVSGNFTQLRCRRGWRVTILPVCKCPKPPSTFTTENQSHMSQSSQRFRSLLFVPGNRADMLEKATRNSPGGFIPDLEDSVPLSEKEAARTVVAEAIPNLLATGKRVVPRINSLATGLTEGDIAGVVLPGITAISIGKIASASDIGEVDRLLTAKEQSAGIEPGSTGILPWLETASAIVNSVMVANSTITSALLVFSMLEGNGTRFGFKLHFSRTVGGDDVRFLDRDLVRERGLVQRVVVAGQPGRRAGTLTDVTWISGSDRTGRATVRTGFTGRPRTKLRGKTSTGSGCSS